MKIVIETVDHKDQRYNTIGDYWIDEGGVLQIRVSNLGNTLYEKMIAIHELTEQALTEFKGIPEKEITEFDLMFEKEREQGLHKDNDEPGFDLRSPYHDQHALATSFELGMCALAGIKWNEYSNKVNSL